MAEPIIVAGPLPVQLMLASLSPAASHPQLAA